MTRLVVGCCFAVLLACGDDAGPPVIDAAAAADAAAADATAADAAAADASAADASMLDGGGAADASMLDGGGAADAGTSDGGIADAATADAATGDGGDGCGALGKPCENAGDCDPMQICEFTLAGQICVPSRPGCGGFVGAMCDDPTAPICVYYVSADYGPCLKSGELECICATTPDALADGC